MPLLSDDQLNKILDKIPTDKVYEDLLQPGLKRVGEALSNVFDLGNLIMLPFKLVNERSRIYLKYNLERYEKKLASVPKEELCQVSEQIGLPIIDKLTLINQEELSETFINLLTKASTVQTLYLVHPSFLSILNNLSQDEAIILFANKECKKIPCIDVYINKEISSIPKPDDMDTKPKSREQLNAMIDYTFGIENIKIKAAENLTGIEKDIKLYFPQNIDIYIENLARSGIISFKRETFFKRDIEKYNKLKIQYQDVINNYEATIMTQKLENATLKILVSNSYIEFTEFGKAFVNAVIKDIEEIEK